jgi:flagellar basal body-associated protein FliL
MRFLYFLFVANKNKEPQKEAQGLIFHLRIRISIVSALFVLEFALCFYLPFVPNKNKDQQKEAQGSIFQPRVQICIFSDQLF